MYSRFPGEGEAKDDWQGGLQFKQKKIVDHSVVAPYCIIFDACHSAFCVADDLVG
jgi:hypothetical protein